MFVHGTTELNKVQVPIGAKVLSSPYPYGMSATIWEGTQEYPNMIGDALFFAFELDWVVKEVRDAGKSWVLEISANVLIVQHKNADGTPRLGKFRKYGSYNEQLPLFQGALPFTAELRWFHG